MCETSHTPSVACVRFGLLMTQCFYYVHSLQSEYRTPQTTCLQTSGRVLHRDENILPCSPTLPKAGRGGAVVRRAKPSRCIAAKSKLYKTLGSLVSWESCHKVVSNPSEPSTAASESERQRVLILLICTAGRA